MPSAHQRLIIFKKPSLIYQGFSTESSGGTTLTYSGVPFGAPFNNRLIVVAIGVRSTGTSNGVTAVTIGGITASQVIGASASTNSVGTTDIWYAAVPISTGGTVVVTQQQ